jgi:hypothetical protein
MQQNGNPSMAEGGREASRQRRKYMAEGKQALPTKAERTRTTRRETDAVRSMAAPAPAPSVAAPAKPVAAAAPAPVAPAAPAPKMPSGGRDASRARRQALVQGKKGLGKLSAPAPSAPTRPAPAAPAAAMPVSTGSSLSGGRKMAQAVRAARAQNGRGNSDLSKPTGRVRNTEALKYPPKVELTKTYGAQSVTGVRIGSGRNVTGTEPGIDKPISGTQYIAADGMGAYRPQAMKVGASKTENGRIVTGTQVRSKVTITGDEFRNSVTITGEADQTLDDDVIERGDAGYPATAQFRRQNNPHGSSVFGANLGRSIKHYGSRERGAEDPATETSLGGHRISGSAIGRSAIVTGDEPGACRPITGSQYLRAAADQPLCEMPAAPTPALTRMGMMPARGETETWARQRITGVEVEFKPGTTGDEAGTCAPITGTPYSGPAQYETYCETDMADQAAARMSGAAKGRPQITGNLPLNGDGVTGTQRGAARDISGTPYYRQGAEADAAAQDLSTVAGRFSVKSPQRDAQLASEGAGHITGSFAVGSGKVTGNSEFDYVARYQGSAPKAAASVTGEGRVEGPKITGSAWSAHGKVTGTEGFTAAGRNPTERTGKPQAFAGAGAFKGQGKTKSPTHDVTGMAGTDTAAGGGQKARITLSGGARG